MDVRLVLHMNGGEGKTSYANNSLYHKMVILKAKTIVDESIKEFLHSNIPGCITIADLGCSSGPNTLLPIWQMIETIDITCHKLNHQKPPSIQVFLNDLTGNDFNTVFKSLPGFYEKLEKQKGRKPGSCFIAAMPGSFYGRLFPDHSIHFVHSSYSLHWLSQVPNGLVDEFGMPLNKGTITMVKTSPPSVQKAYSDQFKADFTSFLSSRYQEMTQRGRLILTFVGKTDDEDDDCVIWDLLGMTLNDMVIQGLIEEGKLDAFDMPVYAPTAEEMRNIILAEGSFNIKQLETLRLPWDANIEDGYNKNHVFDLSERGEFVGNYMRAVFEPILVTHFGDDHAIMDELFHRFAIKAVEYLQLGKGMYSNLVISLSKE